MARVLRLAQRKLYAYALASSSSSSSSSIRTVTNDFSRCLHSRDAISTALSQTRSYGAEAMPKSPIESNILRVLRNEIEYQSEYAPPQQPVSEFNSFTVQDRPGEQCITMRRKFGDQEEIKIDATMFDGYEDVPKFGDDSSGVNVRLHISLLVDISKGEGGSELEFLCSAWPENLEIEKVYILKRDRSRAIPYMGPDFRTLSAEIQDKFVEYLKARGVNNELSVFLHDYMKNKDRIEFKKNYVLLFHFLCNCNCRFWFRQLYFGIKDGKGS